ncbi:MAG: heavy-metal-associated domain-containing protein [Ilumatobacter sp.]
MSDQRLYSVPDISCEHCEAAIVGEVSKVDGVNNVQVDIAGRSVLVVGGDDSAIRAAIDEAGYDVA